MSEDVEVVGPDRQDASAPAVQEPGKLMRIALMLREMQEEARRADVDPAGRDRLREVQERAVTQLTSVLSSELADELTDLHLPFEEGTPTDSEIRVAQAQLIGWLEGLFQGIQAAIFTQQMAARQQLEEMRRPGLPPGQPQGRPPHGRRETGTGQYL